jgi:hypothetical protein
MRFITCSMSPGNGTEGDHWTGWFSFEDRVTGEVIPLMRKAPLTSGIFLPKKRPQHGGGLRPPQLADSLPLFPEGKVALRLPILGGWPE